MDLRDLRFFVALANIGNTRRAAEHIHRSQPALIKAIERLEASLETQLFERDGRGQRLTPAGYALLARAIPLLDAANTLSNEVAAFGRGTSGHIRLGTGSLGGQYLMGSITRLLFEQAPDIWLEMTERMNYELREGLRAGTLDLVIGLVPEKEHEFQCERLFDDVVVIAARQEHALLSHAAIDLEKLSQCRWVLPNSSVASRQWLDNSFARAGLPLPLVQVQTSSTRSMAEIVANTDLVTFISQRTLAETAGKLREIPVKELQLRRGFGLTYSKERAFSPATQRLAELLRTHGERLFYANG